MDHVRNHRLAVAWGLALALAACGTRLLRDPSFELWCGEKLCAPWEVKGEIARVGTWHPNDYGVSLLDGGEISQLVKEDPVECIEFELIADVEAEAAVQLELDFMDDGVVDRELPIAESHWARLRFEIVAPTWYRDVRFSVRKLGKGRAVLAQLSATSSSGCKGKPIQLDRRPDGGQCERAEQCASGTCSLVPQRFAALSGTHPVNQVSACGGCKLDPDCAQGQVCGVLVSDYGPHRSCVQPGSGELGAFCEQDAQCGSDRCLSALPFVNATCAECGADEDCAEGEVCGLETTNDGAFRVCEPLVPAALGALCAGNDQCESGVCCFGACSECCGEWFPCADGVKCGSSQGGFFSRTSLCAPGVGDRGQGESCGTDLDCKSGRCRLEPNVCAVPGNEDSSDFFEAACRVDVQLAGVCR
ncbi:MAG TPA: hypothetical protein VK509_01855 [Polyangiales bacterium]|nr:hypothetical protein [Polyangiales bacterium]